MTNLFIEPVVFVASFASAVLGFMMGALSLFLILLVLVQRGRGGGLTGALGGPGGQSAFGSKAGDTFTIITVVVAAIWAFTCAFTMWLLGTHSPVAVIDTPSVSSEADEEAETDTLTIPASDSFGLSGLSGGDQEEAPATENDVELVPADAGANAAAGTDGAGTDGAESAVEEVSPEADESAADDSDTPDESTSP